MDNNATKTISAIMAGFKSNSISNNVVEMPMEQATIRKRNLNPVLKAMGYVKQIYGMGHNDTTMGNKQFESNPMCIYMGCNMPMEWARIFAFHGIP